MEARTVGIGYLLEEADELCNKMRQPGLTAGTAGDKAVVLAMIDYIKMMEKGTPIGRITYDPCTGGYEFRPSRKKKSVEERLTALETLTADN